MTRPRLLHRARIVAAALVTVGLVVGGGALSASAANYTRLSGEGSSWAGNALAQWSADVKAQGVTVDFTPNGASQGRKDFATPPFADFAVSEIPYAGDTADPQDTARPAFGYGLLPVVAGGTSFMYNLDIGGNRFTSLKLSQAALAGIFTGQITRWNDPAIAADNAGVPLPNQQITVVVRSDGSGATAQFTLWLLRQFPQLYAKLCAVTHCDPAHATSYFPYQGLKNFTAQNGSIGVTTYSSSTPYTINYDEYSYAKQIGFPVAQVKNAAGFYTIPDQNAVAVALIKAKINTDPSSPNYLAQDLSDVYQYQDPRTYPLSAYSYLVVPTVTHDTFSTAKGATLGFFSQYALCEGQRTMGALGYSPLPMNLVLAALDQVLRVPGVDDATKGRIANTKNGVLSGGSDPCNNPTFRAGDDPAHNILVDTAPFPSGCNAACQAPWKLASAGVAQSGPDAGKGGTAKGGSTTGGTGAGSGSGTGDGASDPNCDADAGTCDTIDASRVSASKAVPTTLPTDTGWAAPPMLIGVGFLLVAVLLVGPPLVNQLTSRRRKDQRW